MAGDRIKLVVKERESSGTRSSRRLRREGFVPGVLYGGRGKPRAFCVQERELHRVLSGEHGLHAILDVVLEGQETPHHAVLKDYQLDPRRSTLIHVDFHEIRLDQPIQTQVVVELVGTSEGATRGGVLQLVLREVTVEALPTAIPDRFELDVTELWIGDSSSVADLQVPEDATVIDDPDTVVATVLAPRLEVEEEAAEEEGEVSEEEAAAAPDAAAEEGAEAEGGPGTVPG
jgi:large subunit ribosomal protein L25